MLFTGAGCKSQRVSGDDAGNLRVEQHISPGRQGLQQVLSTMCIYSGCNDAGLDQGECTLCPGVFSEGQWQLQPEV